MNTRWKTIVRRILQFGAQLPKFSSLGWFLAVLGTLLVTLCILAVDAWLLYLPDPGLFYLPLVAMLAYHWRIRYALMSAVFQLLSVTFFFSYPLNSQKPLENIIGLLSLTAVTVFVLFLVQLARVRRATAELHAQRLAALNRVGTALVSELDEEPLLRLIAETACSLTGATLSAFTLRPTNELGHPTVPAEGQFFYPAVVIGVTDEQKELFRRVPLGGNGLLAPIFRRGQPILIDDVLDPRLPSAHALFSAQENRPIDTEQILSRYGVPEGHPLVRSFLGVPLLDRNHEVIGGLLLGHHESARFTEEQKQLIVGLAAQAAVALENARLYHITQVRAQELNALFEGICDGVVLVDAQGQIIRENSAAHRIRETLQENHEEALAQLLTIPAKQALSLENGYEHTICIADAHNDDRYYLVKASPLYILQTSSYLYSIGMEASAEKNLSATVITWHDITEAHRLLAERRAYAESEARRTLLQLVLDELPSSVYLVRGSSARLVLANRATETIWGATWRQDQPMSEFLEHNGIRIFSNDGLTMPEEQLATMRAVQQGESIYQHQEIIRHADSSSLPMLVNAVAFPAKKLHLPNVLQESPDELAAIVIHQDVTALKEVEQLKDEFISIAAHELRTPLAVLKGSAQTLVLQSMRGHGIPLADWQYESLNGIEYAIDRLIELTEDLLDVTRLQAGLLAFNLVSLDLVPLVAHMVERLQLTTQKHRLLFLANAGSQIVSVDPQRLEQVICNILGNAVKYSPDGGTIEVIVGYEEREQGTMLTIRDHGIGIPPHQQAQIFSRFVRADNARVLGIGGTGLGLYLCREFIVRQGGRIWFESVEGQGTIFTIVLPLAFL